MEEAGREEKADAAGMQGLRQSVSGTPFGLCLRLGGLTMPLPLPTSAR